MPFPLAQQLLEMSAADSRPQDLPGRYGRVIADLDRLLIAADSVGVIAGGWAVWHHGYAGRVTEDVDIVVPADSVDQFRRSASVCGFDFLASPAGRWPKLEHRGTGIDVDLLPEGGIPGTPSNLAPIAIGHPDVYGARARPLTYVSLEGLAELKLGAGRMKDKADLIKLIQTHPERLPDVRSHLASRHPSYPAKWDTLVHQAQEET